MRANDAALATKASLGQLPNAPLALVLAQVVFSRYLTIGQRIPVIQDAVRREYPLYSEQKVHALEIGPAGISTKQVDRWQFAAPDNHEGFVLLEAALVFHATHYRDYPAFSDRLYDVLRSVERLVPDLHVERLGLRYVDIIVPVQNEEPEEFVVPGLRAGELRQLGARAITSMHFSQLEMAEGYLNFRYSRGVTEPFMPDDLLPLTLSPAAIVDSAREAVAGGATVAFLDFDRIVPNIGSPFDADAIRARFDRMHADQSAAFKLVQSGHARAVWSSRTHRSS